MEGTPEKPKAPHKKFRIKLKLPQLTQLARPKFKPKGSTEQSDSLPGKIN
jgi:hypothetical protein